MGVEFLALMLVERGINLEIDTKFCIMNIGKIKEE